MEETGTPQRSRIVESVRQAIIDGTYPAGGQLPNQAALAETFGVSGFTVQRALNQLAQEGFIVQRPRIGTRVVDLPPHLRDLAFVFEYDPSSPEHSSGGKLYAVLAAAASDFQRETDRHVYQFHGVDQRTDTPDRQRLLANLRAHQLAGIIFSHPPVNLEGTPILEQPGVPRIAFARRKYYPQVPSVTVDGFGFVDRALDYLVSRGRRRIAFLLVPNLYSDGGAHLEAAIAARGLHVPPHWRLTLSQKVSEGAANCVRLLMYGNGATRPDGLVIFDDNLAEHAIAGLVASGVRVPQDVEVVEHCNFPWSPSVVPTRRLGFHAREIIRRCVEIVDAQRRGETVPDVSVVPARFEDELAAAEP